MIDCMAGRISPDRSLHYLVIYSAEEYQLNNRIYFQFDNFSRQQFGLTNQGNDEKKYST